MNDYKQLLFEDQFNIQYLINSYITLLYIPPFDIDSYAYSLKIGVVFYMKVCHSGAMRIELVCH